MMLFAAAASSWSVEPDLCRAENGEVIHTPSAGGLRYGALVDGRGKATGSRKGRLKPPQSFKLIGTPAKRLDTPQKVNGTAVYGIDVKLPGMKVATMQPPPYSAASCAAWTTARRKAVRGVRQIVRLDDASPWWPTTWAQPRRDSRRSSSNGTTARTRPSARLISSAAGERIARPAAIVRKEGDNAAAMATAAQKLEAVYQLPFLAHAAMEPMNCTVHVRQGQL